MLQLLKMIVIFDEDQLVIVAGSWYFCVIPVKAAFGCERFMEAGNPNSSCRKFEGDKMTGQDQTSGTGNRFLNEILALRQAARDVMAAQAGGPAATTALLQTALSAEIVCVMRYTAISISQDGLKNNRIGAEFQEQANDERRHMSIVAARIEQLGGTPDYNHHPVRDRGSFMTTPAAHFLDLVHENLTAEKCVVELYHDLIALFTPHDPVTCAMLREIVRDEEDHTGDMEDLVALHAT